MSSDQNLKVFPVLSFSCTETLQSAWTCCPSASAHRSSSLETRKFRQTRSLKTKCMMHSTPLKTSPHSSLIKMSPRRPSSLDAYVFGHLAPILKSKLPNVRLQQHLKSLDNLSDFCTNVLLLYFPRDGRGETPRVTASLVVCREKKV